MSKFLFTLSVLVAFNSLRAQNVAPFELKNVDGKMIQLSDYQNKKAVVVIFTGNHCVYSKKYEDRIISLHTKYSGQGVQVLLINSNNPATSEDEKFEIMISRSKEKGYPFPYLQDAERMVAKLFSATKNPEAFLLVHENGTFKIVYKGNLDDNALMPEKVGSRFLEDAISAVLMGNNPSRPQTETVGCAIREL